MNEYTKQVIHGDCPSKSNSYKIIKLRNHASLMKTKQLKEYENSFFMQCGLRDKFISNFFKMTIDCYFGSARKDLDNAFKVILDCLQSCRAIKNDRLCTAITARKFIDKKNPRIEFIIEDDKLIETNE